MPSSERVPLMPTSRLSLPSDVVGVIAEFCPTDDQCLLMLVNTTWYQGVVQQDGVKPRPGMRWPWCALQERQPKNIRLDGYCSFSFHLVVEQAAEVLPELSELRLINSDRPCDSVFCNLPSFHHLTSLHVSVLPGSSFDPTLLISYVAMLPRHHLTALSLNGFKFSDAHLLNIATSFPRLTSLDLHDEVFEVDSVSSTGIDHLCALTNLQSLNIGAFEVLEDGDLGHLLTSCSQLTSLNVSSCRRLAGLQIGLDEKTTFPHLTDLNLQQCFKFCDVALGSLSTHMPNLQHLHLGQTDVTDVGVEALCLNIASVVSLSLESCNIFDEALDFIATSQLKAHLNSLTLSRCTGITDRGIKHLAVGCGKEKALRTLKIDSCYCITDIGINLITRHLTELRELSMACVGNATDGAFCNVSCLQELTSLDISNCHLVTSTTLDALRKDLKKLVTLHCDVDDNDGI